MGGYNDLKTAITTLIHTNDNQEITGATLQSALLSIINTIGQGSIFKGVATTSTNPGSPDADVFYIAGRPGFYPNFNLELTAGLHVIENKSGVWVNTKIALDFVDAIDMGGSKHIKPSQAMIVALQSVEQIPDSEGLANKMWWSTDGHLKHRHNDIVYDLGNPAYVLYYCGDNIYKWTGSGFREIGGGGTFASGEAISSMSIFDDGSDTDGKSSAQLATMIPSGEVIKSLLQLISSIDTSGGSYDGVDLITTFSYDAPTRVITVKQSGRQAKTLLLPLANSTNAGLMSSEDKTQLASMQNLIGKTVDSFSKSTATSGAITLALTTSNGTPWTVIIPVASLSEAGLMTPAVVQQISNIASKLITHNGIQNSVDQGGNITLTFILNDNTRETTTISLSSLFDNKANLVKAGNLAGNMLDMDEWPRTVISNISSEDMPSELNPGDVYFIPYRQQGGTIRPASLWIYVDDTNDISLGVPTDKVVYCHKTTGNLYIWDSANSEFAQVGGSNIDPTILAGKADKHVAADILAPSQWPHVMIYNIESMWGAGGTPPDYASIPVGSIYLDDSDSVDDPPYRRLFYKKTLEGTSQRIDLGAPQENTIYCHIATGKLYRWIPTQNGNDGAFQQIGGQPDIDLSQYATKNDLLTKQDALTFDDVPGNTDNPVKSVGIKQAIDNITPHIGANGNWWTGAETNPSNDTGIKAQGPKGDSVVGGSVNIVNNVNDGGEADALSAEMGKILRINLMKIYNALGVYAFPDGKPILNWGSTVIKHRITASLSNLVVSSVLVDGVSNQYLPAQITDGQSLSFVLNTQSDLYIIDSGNLAITMGGVDIKLAAYNAYTGAVSIPAVNGDILISAVGYTYLQQNLAFQLDCLHGVTLNGAVPTKWTDLVGNVEFNLTDVTIGQDGSLVFNGSTSKGISDSSLNVSFNSATVEVVAKADTYENNEYNPVLANTINGGSCAIIRRRYNTDRQSYYVACSNACNGTGITGTPLNISFSLNNKLNFAFGATRNTVVIDGVEQLDPRHEVNGNPVLDVNDFTGRLSTVLGVGYMNSSQTTPAETFFAGKILAIRVYTSELTLAQMQANYAIDKKRFNLS